MTKLRKAFWDIETSPNIGTFWRPGHKISLSYDNIIQERTILCAAWTFDDDDTIYYSDKLKFNKGVPDDKAIVEDLAKAFEDVDILIHQNGDKFDLPWVNGRALYHGIPRIAPVRTLDILKIARKTFNLNSYRLDYLGEYLGVGNKIETSYGLWKDVMAGDKRALNQMIEYNQQDVHLLREVYKKIEPYNDSVVIDNTIDEDNPVCPFCNSKHIQSRGRYLNLKTYRNRYQCRGCGKFLKSVLHKK